jgi:hypothetical protein
MIVAAEKRMTMHLMAFWNECRGEDGTLPSLAMLRKSDLASSWEMLFVLRVNQVRAESSSFEHFGSDLERIFGLNYKWSTLEKAFTHPILGPTLERYAPAIHDPLPVLHQGAFPCQGGVAKFRSLIAPLSQREGVVDYLIGTANYKIFPA